MDVVNDTPSIDDLCLLFLKRHSEIGVHESTCDQHWEGQRLVFSHYFLPEAQVVAVVELADLIFGGVDEVGADFADEPHEDCL